MNKQLFEMRIEFLERAEPSPEWSELIKANGIDLREAYARSGCIAVTRCEFFDGRRFDFAGPDGELSAVLLVLGEDAKTVIDLVAWPIADPYRFATALGHAALLGVDQVTNPASYFGGEPLRLHRLPLAWLRAGCRGAVLLRHGLAAVSTLARAPGRLAGEDRIHARELAAMLRGSFPLDRIMAPIGDGVAA
jgi:hypothetical protein